MSSMVSTPEPGFANATFTLILLIAYLSVLLVPLGAGVAVGVHLLRQAAVWESAKPHPEASEPVPVLKRRRKATTIRHGRIRRPAPPILPVRAWAVGGVRG